MDSKVRKRINIIKIALLIFKLILDVLIIVNILAGVNLDEE